MNIKELTDYLDHLPKRVREKPFSALPSLLFLNVLVLLPLIHEFGSSHPIPMSIACTALTSVSATWFITYYICSKPPKPPGGGMQGSAPVLLCYADDALEDKKGDAFIRNEVIRPHGVTVLEEQVLFPFIEGSASLQAIRGYVSQCHACVIVLGSSFNGLKDVYESNHLVAAYECAYFLGRAIYLFWPANLSTNSDRMRRLLSLQNASRYQCKDFTDGVELSTELGPLLDELCGAAEQRAIKREFTLD